MINTNELSLKEYWPKTKTNEDGGHLHRLLHILVCQIVTGVKEQA